MVDYDLTETKDGEWDVEWRGSGKTVRYHVSANDCDEWKRNPTKFFLNLLDDIERDIEIWREKDVRDKSV